METTDLRLGVSDFVAVVNQTFDYAVPSAVIIGEVSGLSIRQGKWVRFKLKDDASSVDFFGSIYQMNTPLEDGMMVAVLGKPKLSDKWGFSVSMQSVQAVGEGSIKRSFELLQKKLEAEGLFDVSRKRALPDLPTHIGVISSTEAAGYADFMKILQARWGGMNVEVARTLVQGVRAPGQIIRAIEYFNSSGNPPEVLVLVRGGGDADDLAAFNDETLVRALAASRIPTLVGVGHEIDTTLADLVADVRAATPTNAAQLLVPDKREIIERSRTMVRMMIPAIQARVNEYSREKDDLLSDSQQLISERLSAFKQELEATVRLLGEYNPMKVLARGYALVRGEVQVGKTIEVETKTTIIQAEVTDVRKR